MDEREATWIAEDWSGGRGLVPRGPRWVLGFSPAHPRDVERHTGRPPPAGMDVWRIDVGGRFLRSGGLVYPRGIPYPDELAGTTATISSEVWLYADDRSGRILGVHTWPEAVRRPIASVPRDGYPTDAVLHPDDAGPRLDVRLPRPGHPAYSNPLVVCLSRTEAVLLLVRDIVPEPLHDMLLYEKEGLSLRVTVCDRPDFGEVLDIHQPPYRRMRMAGAEAIGREVGRTLGPQTWPWPGELLWWSDGILYELKGFCGLDTLAEVARSV